MDAHKILNVEPTASRAEIRLAYRKLARRWHPDRFQAGPEREWANDRMAQINAAYSRCLSDAAKKPHSQEAEREQLSRVEELIDDGRLQDARQLLMRFTTRCAEWNYLFGALLLRLCEYGKALTFLSVATHQNPQSEKYRRAQEAARAAGARRRGLFGGLRG